MANSDQNATAFHPSYDRAWKAYLCATHGHVFTWHASNTSNPNPPKGCMCQRCGMVKK